MYGPAPLLGHRPWWSSACLFKVSMGASGHEGILCEHVGQSRNIGHHHVKIHPIFYMYFQYTRFNKHFLINTLVTTNLFVCQGPRTSWMWLHILSMNWYTKGYAVVFGDSEFVCGTQGTHDNRDTIFLWLSTKTYMLFCVYLINIRKGPCSILTIHYSWDCHFRSKTHLSSPIGFDLV